MNGYEWRNFVGRITVVAGVGLAGVACSDVSVDDGDARADQKSHDGSSGFPNLHAFIADYVEIDRIEPDGVLVCDANYHVGADPSDGSPSAEQPACTHGDCSFVDWHDLCEDDLDAHRYVDDVKSDATSFPRSNHCVGPSQVLSKMDLTYVMVANNSENAYFAAQRRNNNGDSAYFWLLTRNPPVQDMEDPACKSGEYGLWYDIQGANDGAADVLLIGQFHPNAECRFRIFYAAHDAVVDAVAAVDYTSGLWTEITDAATLASVNTTATDAGACGAPGVDVQALVSPGVVEAEIFSEASVPISVLTGGETCGAAFYASVITRPSSSGGTSPTLKDLVGPLFVDFGSVSATAELSPSCERGFDFDVTSVMGLNGIEIDPESDSVSCDWTFTNGDAEYMVEGACSGTFELPVDAPGGTWTGMVSVTVAAGNGTCGAEVSAGSAEAFDTLEVVASATASCAESFSYGAVASGGSGSYSYAWAFSGPSATNPSESAEMSGDVEVASAGAGMVYTAAVTVTDLRDDVPVACTAADNAQANPLSPITVSLDLVPDLRTCPGITTDAITWDAMIAGGSGSYVLDWTVDACDGMSSCMIDPNDSEFCGDGNLALSVSNVGAAGLPSCADADSETETWSKVTTVTASDN